MAHTNDMTGPTYFEASFPRECVLPFVEEVCALAEPYGQALRPKFRICDTLGLGLPYEDVAWPRSVPSLIKEVRTLGVGAEDLEFHPHNDTRLAMANSLAAERAGCAVINGTLLGKGERTGNAPLEGVLLHLIGMGYLARPPSFVVLNELAALYGNDAHRTRAGIHADGLNKFWWMYAPFDVPTLLGRPLEVSLTKESGLAGVIFVLKQHTGIEVPKDDPGLLRIAPWMERGNMGGKRRLNGKNSLLASQTCAHRKPAADERIIHRYVLRVT